MFCVQYTAYIKQRRTEACGGAGNSLFLGISERAGSIGTRRCAELLSILRVCIVMNHAAQNPPLMQQPWYAPDGDQHKSPEIATGRRTSPSADACPTPHCGKTQRCPARHVPASVTRTRVRVPGRDPDQRTPPTRCDRHRLPARMTLPRLPPRTHAAPHTPHAGTARTHPHPACTQKAPGNKVFRTCQAGARDSGNKIDWSQNGEGGPEAGALGAEAVGVGGCARLPSSAAGMRSVPSTRLRCAWTLWAVSGNPSGTQAGGCAWPL